MKFLEEIKERYQGFVSHYLPHRIEEAGEIGYQIELFLAQAEKEDYAVAFMRLKEEGDKASTTLYNQTKNEGGGEKVDDLFLLVSGKPIYFGFDLIKVS